MPAYSFSAEKKDKRERFRVRFAKYLKRLFMERISEKKAKDAKGLFLIALPYFIINFTFWIILHCFNIAWDYFHNRSMHHLPWFWFLVTDVALSTFVAILCTLLENSHRIEH